MNVQEIVTSSVDMAQRQASAAGVRLIATVATSRREADQAITQLPLRAASGLLSVNFLIGTLEAARDCFNALDERVEYIFVDVEAKTPIDLITVAREQGLKSRLFPIKPNDATVEACQLVLRHHLGDWFRGKRIGVVGAGNVGSKVALALAEQGAEVFVTRRNSVLCQAIAVALNTLLPPYSQGRVISVTNNTLPSELDAICAFAPDSQVLTGDIVRRVRTGGLVLDGAIGSFTSDGLETAYQRQVVPIRLDVRPGFPVAVNAISPVAQSFFKEIVGRVVIDGLTFVAGGVVGRFGDVVVDRVPQSQRVIGLADGSGGILWEGALDEVLHVRLGQARDIVLRSYHGVRVPR